MDGCSLSPPLNPPQFHLQLLLMTPNPLPLDNISRTLQTCSSLTPPRGSAESQRSCPGPSKGPSRSSGSRTLQPVLFTLTSWFRAHTTAASGEKRVKIDVPLRLGAYCGASNLNGGFCCVWSLDDGVWRARTSKTICAVIGCQMNPLVLVVALPV